MDIQTAGAFAFGLLIGWYVYYINRHRRGDVQLSDLVTLIGVLGGAAILALFPAQTNLFGAYGLGLAAGFFAYFVFLLLFVYASPNFGADWFLDGRRRGPDGTVGYPAAEDAQRPMGGVPPGRNP